MLGLVGAFVAFAVAVGSGSAVSEAPITPWDLRIGDRGAAVADLNAALIRAGFTADTGDRFGRRTRHAVYAFQKHHGLATNGSFSPLMWDLLS